MTRAYQIFYDIVYEDYDRLNEDDEWDQDRIKAYRDLITDDRTTTRKQVYDWCCEQLDLLGIPEGEFRRLYLLGLKDEDYNDKNSCVLDYLAECIEGYFCIENTEPFDMLNQQEPEDPPEDFGDTVEMDSQEEITTSVLWIE